MKKVFLGGTCNGSTWRDELIPHLTIDYFNPVVEDWTPECQEEEERQKEFDCDTHLYVITSDMKGVFSIAEAVESAMRQDKTCVLAIALGGFDKQQANSLRAVANLVSKYDNTFITNSSFSPKELADIVNTGGKNTYKQH